jgi:hypothetical protein
VITLAINLILAGLMIFGLVILGLSHSCSKSKNALIYAAGSLVNLAGKVMICASAALIILNTFAVPLGLR